VGVEPLTGIEGGELKWAYFRDPKGNVFEITRRSPRELDAALDSLGRNAPSCRNVTQAEPVDSSSAHRLDEFRKLLDEASEAFETSEGDFLRRFRSALAVFRGRWGVVFHGILAWGMHAGSAGVDRGHVAAVDRVVEQALHDEDALAVDEVAEVVEPALDDKAVADAQIAAEALPDTEAAERTRALEPEGANAVQRQRERDEALIEDVRARRQAVERELEADAKRLRFFELCVYSLLVIAAVIALTIATIGAVIILSNPAAGAIVTAVALVPGSGAAILFRLARTLGLQRKETAAARERNSDALESVQARLSISDQSERDRMIGEYATALRSK
jgi:hypothetical protein